MSYNTIDVDSLLAGGDSTDVKIRAMMSFMRSVADNKTIPVITDLADIGMSRDTNTLSEIATHMPMGSLIIMGVAGSGAYAANLPMPTLSNGATKVFTSGQILMFKDTGDWNKVYMWYAGGANLTASAMYNGNFGASAWSGWKFNDSAPLVARPTPAEFDNKMSNVWVSGSYYFNTSQMNAFTDKPSGAGAGYLKVINSGGLPGSDKFLEFTENGTVARSWRRISYSSQWVSIPCLFPNAVPDTDLRIGDMKIAGNGDLAIRINATTVKYV